MKKRQIPHRIGKGDKEGEKCEKAMLTAFLSRKDKVRRGAVSGVIERLF